jgi:protein required for attachment to host cells
MPNQQANGLVLVCDGKKALFLENTGSDFEPHLETRQVEEHADPRSRDINSDAPGRAFSSVGQRRGAVDDGDPHELAEERFLKSMAERVEKFAANNQFRDVVLVAPPRALGILRSALSSAAKKKLKREIEKDLVKMPVPEIEQYLARANQAA